MRRRWEVRTFWPHAESCGLHIGAKAETDAQASGDLKATVSAPWPPMDCERRDSIMRHWSRAAGQRQHDDGCGNAAWHAHGRQWSGGSGRS